MTGWRDTDGRARPQVAQRPADGPGARGAPGAPGGPGRSGAPGRPGAPGRSGDARRGTRPGRPRGRWKAAVFALAAAGIVAAAVWALLGSSLFVVRSVTVTGTHLVPRAEVLRAAGIAPGTPLARINTGAVARRVERIAQVQSAQVSRHWPSAVAIAVQERTPALAVASGGGYELVDRFGVVVRQVARLPGGMVVLAPAPAALRGSPAIRAAVTVLGQLPARIRVLVRTVAAPSASTVTLGLRGGTTVLWGGTDRASAKAAELTILLRSRAAYYDLSDPGTAVTGG